ncbi:hypothetical protein B0O79_0123 [Flavobacteriaceae bacterium MAR_2009_75]|nr:hypothetical protein B0O79_0123 [Flavobacteriaceae bacterium MAR_2009_75]
MNEKKLIKKKLIVEGVLALLIAVSPILFYTYKYLPHDPKSTISIFWIEFSNNGYSDISMAFYFYLSKLIPLFLLTLWFLTNRNWWYHAILIPIAMYSFQLYSVFSDDTKKIDENELLYLLAVCMIVIPVVYLIRVRLFDKYVHGIDLKAMEAELQELKQKQAKGKEDKIHLNKYESEDTIIPSISEEIDEKLSTHNLSSKLKNFQVQLSHWFHLKS